MSAHASGAGRWRCLAPWLIAASGWLAACAPPPRVNFASATVGFEARDYAGLHRRWTRHGHVTRAFDTPLDAHVTLLSEEFRRAYVAKVATMRELTSAQRAQLEADQQIDGQRYVEFVVEMVCTAWEWNDLNSVRSVWTLTLIDDRGREAGRPDIKVLLDKEASTTELFPPVDPFTRTWRVRFLREQPNGGQLLDPATRWIELRIAGPLGRANLRWEAER